MSQYMKGYRDGFATASLENHEDVYETQCSRMEHELAQLVIKVQRMRPASCKSEMREYIAKSQYYTGFRDGYIHGRRRNGAR